MLATHIRHALRILKKDSLYTCINILGLSLSLGAFMLIVMYLTHEYSFDRFHANAKRIYQVNETVYWPTQEMHTTTLSYGVAPSIKNACPMVETYTRFTRGMDNKVLMTKLDQKDNPFTEKGFHFADSTFFRIFSFKSVRGDLRHALDAPFTLVISQTTALRYFGHEDPIGKTLLYKNNIPFTITGVVQDPPSNSSIQFSMVGSMSSLNSLENTKIYLGMPIMYPTLFNTFVLLAGQGDSASFSSSLAQLAKANASGFPAKTTFFISHLWENHLSKSVGDTDQLRYLTILPIVGVLVLLLALINYMSLITAKATNRAAEVGIRKVLGAGKGNMVQQFYTESTVLVSIAFIGGVAVFVLCKPLFLQLIGYTIDTTFFFNPYLLLAYLGVLLLTAALAGSYPALILSAFKPIDSISGKASKVQGGNAIRKTLTVLQFSISICLIICSLVMFQQFQYVRHKDTGVNRKHILMVPYMETLKNYTAFKADIEALPGVQKAGRATSSIYAGGFPGFPITDKALNKQVNFTMMGTDSALISLLDLHWQIRPYSATNMNDPKGVILNSAAVKAFDISADPIGKTLDFQGERHTVMGVLKDFVYASLNVSIEPMGIVIYNDTTTSFFTSMASACLYLKLAPQVNEHALVDQINKIYLTYDKATPFTYYFMDEAYTELYEKQERLGNLLGLFTALTIFIACMGLFGLSSFSAAQRMKEVCIRKVLGASTQSLVTLLIRGFFWLIFIALLIAAPVAWYIMRHWLDNYAYHIPMTFLPILLTGIAVLGLGTMTVISQAIKAATRNPVIGLRAS